MVDADLDVVDRHLQAGGYLHYKQIASPEDPNVFLMHDRLPRASHEQDALVGLRVEEVVRVVVGPGDLPGAAATLEDCRFPVEP